MSQMAAEWVYIHETDRSPGAYTQHLPSFPCLYIMDASNSANNAPIKFPFSKDQTIGADLLGTFFGLIFYGLSVHQLYKYYRLFAVDALIIRILVLLVMALQTLHAILTMHF
ncbi:hypothetical protein BD309DRAFT_274797 [Dichomitus squalens]|nr:hypothetical protein BD309DRAFT_274797 [Dichomitus squalens]